MSESRLQPPACGCPQPGFRLSGTRLRPPKSFGGQDNLRIPAEVCSRYFCCGTSRTKKTLLDNVIEQSICCITLCSKPPRVCGGCLNLRNFSEVVTGVRTTGSRVADNRKPVVQPAGCSAGCNRLSDNRDPVTCSTWTTFRTTVRLDSDRTDNRTVRIPPEKRKRQHIPKDTLKPNTKNK